MYPIRKYFESLDRYPPRISIGTQKNGYHFADVSEDVTFDNLLTYIYQSFFLEKIQDILYVQSSLLGTYYLLTEELFDYLVGNEPGMIYIYIGNFFQLD